MSQFSLAAIGRMAVLTCAMMVAAVVAAGPANAQALSGYQFLEAIRDRDGTKVTEALNNGGGALINTRDLATGKTGLQIVVERRDPVWITFLLSRGADANIADREGQTPLISAAQIGYVEGARSLISGGARVNHSNPRGETALHFAVQRRDVAMVRALIAAGADPDLQDSVAGLSARDYAARDNRAAAIVAALNGEAPVVPANPLVAGPN